MDRIKKNFGFGYMRLPLLENGEVDKEQTCKMVDTFLENGFNYFDTAHGYLDGKSEMAIKDCLSSRHDRSEYVLTNKLTQAYFKKQEDIRPFFESQLEICGVDYFDFYLTGGIFNTKAWNEVGGLKESIKVTFWYEFMLRAAHKGEKFYVVPKIGYSHVLGRDGSLLMNYRKTVDTKEAEFWFKLAKKESFFDTDRNKTYDKKDSIDEETESEE